MSPDSDKAEISLFFMKPGFTLEPLETDEIIFDPQKKAEAMIRRQAREDVKKVFADPEVKEALRKVAQPPDSGK